MRLNYLERLTPARKIVALAFDSATIRLLLVKGRRVRRWAKAPVAPGLVAGEVASNPAALGEAVQKLMMSSGIAGSRVITAVSGLYSLSRILSLTWLPGEPDQAEAVVLEEAEMLLPLSVEEQYFAWQLLSSAESEQRVLFIALPRAPVDAQVQVLMKAGIKPYVMELKALALVRAVNREQALVVNVEPDSVDIAVVAAGIPQIMRTVALPGGLSPEDSAHRVWGILEHTVDFYNTHHRSSSLDLTTPLFLTGPLAEGIRELMAAQAAYPLEMLTVPLECPAGFPVSEYAVNIGLVLREI